MVRLKYYKSSSGWYTDWIVAGKRLIKGNIIDNIVYVIDQVEGIIDKTETPMDNRKAKAWFKKQLTYHGVAFYDELRRKDEHRSQ